MTFINIFSFFSEKIRLDVSNKSSARQRIHMKNQTLFSSKDKSKKLKISLLQFLFGTLKVKTMITEKKLKISCLNEISCCLNNVSKLFKHHICTDLLF